VVVVKTRMRPKGSSAEIENRTGQLWTIRDGMVVSMRIFAKPEEALEVAGLSEEGAHSSTKRAKNHR
jgi:ketosteroid isomerase-like protein